MAGLIITGILVLIFSIAMTMVGKGGGNFYVVILAMAGVSMHEAATTGQFILFAASVSAMLIFHRNRSVSWPLAVSVGVFTSLAALGGGYFSHLFSGFYLKMIFAAMLAAAGAIMLIPASERMDSEKANRFGIISIRSRVSTFHINLWVALPAAIITGFGSGMVGVSGGSFLVPLMVIACGVPIRTAVGTAATLIAATSLMGFAGHAVRGDFNPSWAVPLAVVAIGGGIVGSRISLRTGTLNLKRIFAFTNWLAALFMVFNALHAGGVI